MLKIGDKVKIKEFSEYYGQSFDIGIITHFDSAGRDCPYSVEFENGYSNSYNYQDLEIVKKKERKKLKVEEMIL